MTTQPKTQNEVNRQKLLAILKENDISQANAAKIINDVTKRPLSLRAMQSWLATPGHKSARGCPEWAIDVLENYFKSKKE